MRVADEEVNGKRAIGEFLHQRQPKRPDSGAGIEDENLLFAP
jgi:hypothetical protein